MWKTQPTSVPVVVDNSAYLQAVCNVMAPKINGFDHAVTFTGKTDTPQMIIYNNTLQ